MTNLINIHLVEVNHDFQLDLSPKSFSRWTPIYTHGTSVLDKITHFAESLFHISGPSYLIPEMEKDIRKKINSLDQLEGKPRVQHILVGKLDDVVEGEKIRDGVPTSTKVLYIALSIVFLVGVVLGIFLICNRLYRPKDYVIATRHDLVMCGNELSREGAFRITAPQE